MIPKIIHYCWFGRNPLPELAIKCIESWKKYLPDYEIKEWNEDNFDVNIIPYTEEAYKTKKYAFVSDYARFWILYKYGGLYFDTDVEVIKPIDEIVAKGPFIGCENVTDKKGQVPLKVAPGLGLGAPAGMTLYKVFLDYYDGLHFIAPDGTLNTNTTVVEHISRVLRTQGLENTNGIQKVGDLIVYPRDYFCPIDVSTNRLHITNNTYSIHHYAGSWADWSKGHILKKKMMRLVPECILRLYNRIKS